MSKLSIVILAAGRSKRMNTHMPKVLHKAGNRALIDRVLTASQPLNADSVHVVVGYEKQQIMDHLGNSVQYTEQKELLGTGHAVMQVIPKLKDEEEVMVICGDMPLLSAESLHDFTDAHRASGAKLSLMTAVVPWESDFGRIERGDEGNVVKITEYRDASEAVRQIREVNLALYLFDRRHLLRLLPLLKADNAQKELYLTDLVEMTAREGLAVNGYICEDPYISLGVNSRVDLARINGIIRERTMEKLMLSGVTVTDPGSCHIDESVEIGMDSTVHPFTIIEGNTVIGKNCVIGPSAKITDASLGDGVSVLQSTVVSSQIGNHVSVGPYSYIRPGNVVEEGAKIGDFVELKKSHIGKGSKVPHLAYVGDAVLGEGVNIGAGTITCNYDGKNKHRTVIGDGSRIGSNTNLVAPVTLGKNVTTGAGAVVLQDVPDGAMVAGVPAKQKR